MSNKRMIVTADDYGMSIGVNDAIIAGIKAGLITSTNVMTNMNYYGDAARLRDYNVSVGIHWTVSAGRPVCDPLEIPSLVDEEGNFFSYPVFRKRYRMGGIKNSDIVKELRAQYNRFVAVCGHPDYWNTHQNTHVDFGVFRLFVKTAKELGITKMRSHRRVYVPSSNGQTTLSIIWHINEPIKRCVLKNWMKRAQKTGISSPCGVVLHLNKNDCNNLDYSFSNLIYSDDAVPEYVIHPSTVLDSEFFGSIGDQRITEYEQFTSDRLKEIFAKNHIELINFDCLK